MLHLHSIVLAHVTGPAVISAQSNREADTTMSGNALREALHKRSISRGASDAKLALTPARTAELRRRVASGDSKAGLAREFGISRDTLYRYVPVKKRRAGKLAK